MTDNNDSTTPSAATHRRRSSFAGQTFAEIFGTGRSRPSISTTTTSTNNASPTSQMPGPITSAAVEIHRRRMSVTQTGASGSPKEANPLLRRDSMSSANSGSIDESAVEDGFGPDQAQSSSFGRKLSFGARALKDVKSGGGAGGITADRPNGEPGYNWADSFRSRAQRSSSISSASPPNDGRMRAKSVATMQPPPTVQATKASAPDHFQERILKGDFYMD